MRRALLAVAMALGGPGAGAAPWTFDPPEAVTAVGGGQVFHHLDASGRRSIAVSDGVVAVAWEDNRDGTSDVWLAWREGGAWSENVALPGASGAGEQTHPALFLDPAGDLHVAWVERDQVGGPTRLRYAVGRAASASGGRGGAQEPELDVRGR